jgi:hypothetical protein
MEHAEREALAERRTLLLLLLRLDTVTGGEG